MMLYAPNDERRMQTLVTAFHDFIAANRYFDILHSSKSGYIYLTVDYLGHYHAQLIETAAQMMDILVHETVASVKRSANEEDAYNNIISSPDEDNEVICRFVDILITIDCDREWYFSAMATTMSSYFRLWERHI